VLGAAVGGTTVTERHAHLVGSLPGATAREAMSRALDLLGPHLTSLPDGETGERRNWILSVIEGLRDHPDLDLAVFTLGPPAGARHRRAFTEATIAEVRDVADLTGERALFQLEVPFELAVTAKAPAPVRRALVRGLARGITGVAAGAAPGTRFAVHLCMGDMNNRPIDRMTDADRPRLLRAAGRAGPAADRPVRRRHRPRVPGPGRPARHPRPRRVAPRAPGRRGRGVRPRAAHR